MKRMARLLFVAAAVLFPARHASAQGACIIPHGFPAFCSVGSCKNSVTYYQCYGYASPTTCSCQGNVTCCGVPVGPGTMPCNMQCTANGGSCGGGGLDAGKVAPDILAHPDAKRPASAPATPKGDGPSTATAHREPSPAKKTR